MHMEMAGAGTMEGFKRQKTGHGEPLERVNRRGQRRQPPRSTRYYPIQFVDIAARPLDTRILL